MNKYILQLLLAFSAFVGFSQSEEVFRDTIYFIDAVGNKDSLIIRNVVVDDNMIKWYNPELGEELDNRPFDSVFEVRAGAFSFIEYESVDFTRNPVLATFNKQNNDCYYGSEIANFFIYAKYPPVTIKWDRQKWNNECKAKSWITVEPLTTTMFFWWLNSGDFYTCMNESDSIVFDLPYYHEFEHVSPHLQLPQSIRIVSLEDGSQDTIFNVFISPATSYHPMSPCEQIVSTDDEVTNTLQPILIYPNPANDRLTIEVKGEVPDELLVYDNVGVKLIQTKYLPILDISQLLPGIYYLQFVWEDNRRSVGAKPFVKW